jgi:hypothetical protein
LRRDSPLARALLKGASMLTLVPPLTAQPMPGRKSRQVGAHLRRALKSALTTSAMVFVAGPAVGITLGIAWSLGRWLAEPGDRG